MISESWRQELPANTQRPRPQGIGVPTNTGPPGRARSQPAVTCVGNAQPGRALLSGQTHRLRRSIFSLTWLTGMNKHQRAAFTDALAKNDRFVINRSRFCRTQKVKLQS